MRKPSLTDWTSLKLRRNLHPRPAPCPPQTPNLGVGDRSPRQPGPKAEATASTSLKTKPNLDRKDCPVGGCPLPRPPALPPPLGCSDLILWPPGSRPGRWRGAGSRQGAVSLIQSFCRFLPQLLPPLLSPGLFSADRLQRRSRWISGQDLGSGSGCESLNFWSNA